MRHPSLLPLSHDHHHGLALALRCRKQALGQIKPMGAVGLKERADEVLSFFRNNLVAHFRAEEEILFPFMRAHVAGSEAMIDELVRQHKQLRQAMAQIETRHGLGETNFRFGRSARTAYSQRRAGVVPALRSERGCAQADLIGAKLKERLMPKATITGRSLAHLELSSPSA